MLFKFSDLIFFNKKIRGIIHIGAHELEELPEYLNRNLYKIIWVEAKFIPCQGAEAEAVKIGADAETRPVGRDALRINAQMTKDQILRIRIMLTGVPQ